MIKRFLKEILVFLLVSGLSRLLPFLLTPLFTHYMTPDEMGRLELILACYNIMMVFGVCQIDTAIQRYYYERQGIAKLGFLSVLVLSFIAAVLIASASPLISRYVLHDSRYTLHVLLSGLAVFATNIYVVSNIIIRYSRSLKVILFLNVLQTTSFASLAYYFVVVLQLQSLGYIYAVVISNSLAAVLACTFIKTQIKNSYHREDYLKLKAFSLPQLPARVASVLSQYGNRFVILWLSGQAGVGLFSLATKVSSLVLVGLSAFTMVWYPLLYSTRDDSGHKDIRKVFKLVILLMPVAVIVLFILTYFLFKYYVAREYAEAEYLTYVLIIASSFLIIKEMADAGIKISEKVKYISIIYLSNFAILVFLMAGMGSLWGVAGVCYAILIANIMLTFATWIASDRCYKMYFNRAFLYSYLLFSLLSLMLVRGVQ